MIAAKPDLRARLRRRRAEFARDFVWTAAALPSALRTVGVLASYRPTGGEVDPQSAEQIIDADTIAFPRVENRGVMRFLVPERFADWEEGPFSIVQPRAHCREVRPDVVLVPLVGFDRLGNRLGQGGGYYDRALAHLPDAFTVGVAWSAQEVDAIAIDAWDVPMRAILTEREWIEL